MALIVPTADDLCSEGFRRVAGRAPRADELTRAVDLWLEEILAEIWARGCAEDRIRLRALENTSVQVLDVGVRRYDWPSDFYRPISASLLKGTLTGTLTTGPGAVASAVAAGTYVYTNSTSAADVEEIIGTTDGDNSTELSGLWLLITSGTYEGALREITSIDIDEDSGTTFYKINVDRAWSDDELPAAADTFAIVEEAGVVLGEDLQRVMDDGGSVAGLGLPISFSNFDRMMELDVAPDDENVYAVVLRYYVNLMKVDKDSTVMQEILTNWRVPLTRGVARLAAQSLDDSRYAMFAKEWDMGLAGLLAQDSNYWPDFAGFRPGGVR